MRLAPVLLLALSMWSCTKEDRNVVYKVTCSSCDLTYSDSGGNTQQVSMSSTWELKFDADKGQFLYVSAQHNNTGSVSVSIKCQGKNIDDATSSGEYVIATASGSAPD